MFTIDLRPTSELMLALDAVVGAFNRMATAIEAANKIGATSVLIQAQESAKSFLADPGAGRSASPPDAAPSRSEIVAPRTVGRPPTNDRMFSPERNAIIKRDYPLGVSIDAIVAQCHALPGKTIPNIRIPIQASKLGVRRSADAPYVRPAPTKPPDETVAPEPLPPAAPESPVAVEPPAPVATPTPVVSQPRSHMEAMMMVSKAIEARPAPVDPGEPVAADFQQVRDWAAQRGITFESWDDLRAANTRRERLGLPPFKRQFSMRGAVR